MKRAHARQNLKALSGSFLNLILAAILSIFVIAVVRFGMLQSITARQTYRNQTVNDNIHQIQLAIERYATDQDGTYPYFLYGGELNFNIGSVNAVNTTYQHSGYPGGRIIQPFDSANQNSVAAGYAGASWSDLLAGQGDHHFGDVLQTGGYLPGYPRNPFQSAGGNRFGLAAFQTKSHDQACFGGRDGTRSWNLAWFGEAPQLIDMQSNDPRQVRMDFPGSFAYLPIWSDDSSNSAHLEYQAQFVGCSNFRPSQIIPPSSAGTDTEVSSLDVAGYQLLGYGDDRSKGQDIDFSILDMAGNHVWRSGYCLFNEQASPWILNGRNLLAEAEAEESAGDGVEDYVITTVGSGLSKGHANGLRSGQSSPVQQP
ncbi:hypothetical protein KDL44_05935 [bacterium]|nr:hypothetical protein [bacterium]